MGNDAESWKCNEITEVFSFDCFILREIKRQDHP